MISIYSKNNTDFEHNGDAVLIPTSCKLSATINGAWQLTLEHPYDPEERYKYIVEGATIVADIRFIRELSTTRQKFRIYNYVKGLHSVTAIAFPVAMESTYDAPIDNLVISGKTGAQAMAQLQTKTNKYTLSSDITRTGSTSFSNTNINSAIASGDAGCFIDVWGGDILYDNLTFSVKNRLGDNVAADHPVIYGRNLTDIEYKKDDSGLTTRIYPISQDGIRLNGAGYVDSSRISDYPVPHSKFMTAPYSLIDTNAGSSTSTATKTQQAVSGVSTEASTTSQSVYATLKGNGYQPEYIKSIRNAIVEAVQIMALASVVSTSYYNLMTNTIKSAMDWMGSLSQPKWEWMGSDQTGWKYGNASSYAKNMYVKIGKTWSYFGSDGNWQEPKDDSDEWDWHDAKGGTGKKYGNFTKYYAHNEYVYITVNGTIKEYWFNEQGWFEEDESGDSDYYWHGSGTGADPYWFGSSSSDYLKSCWRFIDGTYYFFDSYGYVATQKDNYQWDWNDNGDSSRAWFGNAINSEYGSDGACLKSQWQKINGTWYYFDSNGLVVDEAVSQTQTVAAFTTGMASVKTTVDSWASQLYTLLYSLMTSYANKQFASGVDLPTITITVKMADLKKTTEYADYAHLEEIKLGDSVKCIDAVHDITTENRIIGITYDILRDYNESIVIGSASATVAQMVGNAGGEAAAQGFDTTAIENQLTALRNGKQDKLTAGDNITIENNVISATGGNEGIDVYYGEVAPNNNIGANKDFYLRIGQIEYGTISDQSYSVTTVTLDSFSGSNNEYDIELSGNPGGGWDTILFQIAGLEEDSNYVVSFDIQFGQGTTFAHGTYGNWSQVFNSSSPSGSYEIDPTRTDAVVFAHNLNLQHCRYIFTADESNYLSFAFQNCTDGRQFTVAISNLTISNGEASDRIKSIYNKHEGEWLKYEDDSLIASDIYYDNSISGLEATNTQTAIDEVCGNIIEVEANPSGTTTTDLTKLGIDGTIYDIPVGSEVEANPTDTGSANLTKLKVDGTTYNIQGGGGGSDVEANPTDPATDTLVTIGIDGTVYDIAGGGVGGLVDLGLKYDFTKTTLDVLSLTPIKLENVTITNNGLSFNSNSSYAYFNGNMLQKNTTYEIEVGSLNITDTSRQNALLRYQNVGSTQNAGLIYRYQTLKWAVWDSTNGWQESNITDKDYFNNSIVKVKILSDGKWEIYKDNVLVFAPPLAMVFEGTENFGLGSPNAAASNMTIKSFRAYVDGYKNEHGGSTQEQADWAQTDSTAVDYIKNKPNLATVATSGSYNDLSNKPTIPEIEANPSGTASATLSTLEVDGTIYNVPSGGGSDLPLTVENGKLCIIYET